MDEFLDKLQEDQRRMRKYLSAKGLRFRAMGEALATCGNAGGRVFVAGEPPLDLLTRVIGREYFPHLSVVLIDDPEETAVELTDEDVLLAFLHEGKHKRVRRLLERARARHATVLIVGGLGARTAATKRQAEVMITLPTRGIKTIVESGFICARILARVSRAAMTQSQEGEPVSERKTTSESRRSKTKSSGRKGAAGRSKSSRRSKSAGAKSEGSKSAGRKSEDIRGQSSPRKSEKLRRKSKSKSAGPSEDLETASEAPRIAKRKRKQKLKPSVLELPTISPSELESRPPSGLGEVSDEIPLEELQLDQLASRSTGEDDDLDDLAAELDQADLEDLDDELEELDDDLEELTALQPRPMDDSDEVDLGESIDLDEDLDDEDLDDIDLGESIDDDPFDDMDLEELGAVPRTSSSRPKPISRQPDGSLGDGSFADTKSEAFSPPPLVDDAPVGLVSREDPGDGPTFGSDILLGSDVGVVGTSGPHADLGPISFDDDFLSDLEVQRPASGSRSNSEPQDGISARMVSARFSVRDCTIRWGRGGFPDDSSPAHTLLDFDGGQALFLLDHDDEAAATLAIEDELWVRIEVPAFMEPILTRARILDLAGSAGNGGTTATLQFSELEARTRQKLERAAAARR